MKSTPILAILIAAALPGAGLLAQGEQGKMGDMMKKENPANMSEMHQKMEAEMKAQDAELDKLVSDMNTDAREHGWHAHGYECSNGLLQRRDEEVADAARLDGSQP